MKLKPLTFLIRNRPIIQSKYANLAPQAFSRNFSVSSPATKKSKTPETPGVRVIVPGNCREIKPPTSTPLGRIAVVIGGSNNGFGYFAAEQLLHHGAKRVILADGVDLSVGKFACEKLCKAYGKDRAKFYQCDVRSSCQIRGIFTSTICLSEKVSILFNDLDAIQRLPDHKCFRCWPDPVKISDTKRLTGIGLEAMSGSDSIIVNCASILGFMGWPKPEAVPVYCSGTEPVIEITVQMAKKNSSAPASGPAQSPNSKVRLTCLCPANRPLKSIGLPDLPKDESCNRIPCSPDIGRDSGRIGRALVHLLARAETGSLWLMEPPFTVRENPRLLQASANKEARKCAVSFQVPRDRPETCSVDCKSHQKNQKC